MVAEFTPEQIKRGLETEIIGREVRYYPRLPSTMDAARKEVRRGAIEGTVIIAGEQTGGRGRLQRRWLTPPGNVALSVALYPEVSRLPYLMMMTSLAVVRAIESVTGLEAGIKWPNDVLINGKKVCGILIENEMKRERVDYAIIGIGLNVNLKASALPEVAYAATSLSDELGRDVALEDIIRSLLTWLEHYYRLPDSGAIYREWRDRLATLGKRVTVFSGKDSYGGVAVSVDESGALTVRKDDGTVTSVVAGDVSLREE